MQTTDKLSCNILTDLLVAHGVREAVISPAAATPLSSWPSHATAA